MYTKKETGKGRYLPPELAFFETCSPKSFICAGSVIKTDSDSLEDYYEGFMDFEYDD